MWRTRTKYVYIKGAIDVENHFHNPRQLPKGFSVARATYDLPAANQISNKELTWAPKTYDCHANF